MDELYVPLPVVRFPSLSIEDRIMELKASLPEWFPKSNGLVPSPYFLGFIQAESDISPPIKRESLGAG